MLTLTIGNEHSKYEGLFKEKYDSHVPITNLTRMLWSTRKVKYK